MDRIHLLLAASDGTKWERMVSSVTLPGAQGSLGILPGHAPMLCALDEGTVFCRNEAGERFRFRISAGIANVAENEVTLLLAHMAEE